MIPQSEKDLIIQEFTRIHNVSMLAFNNLLNQRTVKNTVSEKHIEDTKLEVEIFLYDLNCIYDTMQESQDLLCQLREKLK